METGDTWWQMEHVRAMIWHEPMSRLKVEAVGRQKKEPAKSTGCGDCVWEMQERHESEMAPKFQAQGPGRMTVWLYDPGVRMGFCQVTPAGRWWQIPYISLISCSCNLSPTLCCGVGKEREIPKCHPLLRIPHSFLDSDVPEMLAWKHSH